jgi:transcriptional regulator with XRE-family HTH domain
VKNSKWQKCIEMMILGNMTQKQIAEELHVSENTISSWKKNENFVSEYTAALKSSMKEVAAKAFLTETKLLNARSEMVRLLTAKDILDRAGFKADEKMTIEGAVPVIITGENELEN